MNNKANTLHRLIAKAIDLLIFGFFSEIFYPFGFLAGILYLLISDGFFEGQSIGKKLIGLKVVSSLETVTEKEISGKLEFKESIIRNAILAFALLFSLIPFIGYFLLFTVGLLIYAVEVYFIVKNPEGERLGDRFAYTKVVDVIKK